LAILILTALSSSLALLFSTPARAATPLYVKSTGTSSNSCADWGNACDLQTAIGKAVSGDTIWVAAGTYIRSAATFTLNDGVAIYGGFVGTETKLEERNWQTNATILSGDLKGDDGANSSNTIDNTGPVVGGANGATKTAILDGFTIKGGRVVFQGGGMANYNSSPTLANVTFTGNGGGIVGGGMYNEDSSPTLINVTFSNNNSTSGGGMYNDNSSPTLTNVTFTGNSSMSGRGNGMLNYNSSPVLTNVTFTGDDRNGGGMSNDNSSPTLTNVTFFKGGMYNDNSSPTLTNVTFSNGGLSNRNSSSPTLTNVTFFNGGMYNSYSCKPKLQNCIFWGGGITNDNGANNPTTPSIPIISHSIVQGSMPNGIWDTTLGTDGGGNKDIDPLFVDAAKNDLHLSGCSPALDAGNSDVVTATTDLDGKPRKVDGDGDGTAKVDLGAYEHEQQNTRSYGTLAFAAAASSANEGNSSASVPIASIIRTGGSNCAVSVDVDLNGGTAVAGTDFTRSLSKTVTFADGESAAKPVEATILGNTVYGSDKTIGLKLANVKNATLGTPQETIFTILNDDEFPKITLTGKPSNPDSNPAPSFTFSSTDSQAKFECQLDSGAWAGCTSPYSPTSKLAEGSHTFAVRAKDSAVDVYGTPESYTWTIAFPVATPKATPNGAELTATAGGATLTPSPTPTKTSTPNGAELTATAGGATLTPSPTPTNTPTPNGAELTATAGGATLTPTAKQGVYELTATPTRTSTATKTVTPTPTSIVDDCTGASDTVTIFSQGSGDWNKPATWNLNRIPTVNDVVGILTGHGITLTNGVQVKGFCNRGLLTNASSGTLLKVEATQDFRNFGQILSKDGQTVGQNGSSIELRGKPFYNEGTIQAGAGSAGSSSGGDGGSTFILAENTTNTAAGIICAGKGGSASTGYGGSGGDAHVWGKFISSWGGGYLTNYGKTCAGDGGTGKSRGGNGGNLKLISLPYVYLYGKQYAGKGYSGGWNGGDGYVIIEPDGIIDLSGKGTEISGGDVTIFGGNNWNLNLSNMASGAIKATGSVTLAVGLGGSIDLSGSAPSFINAAGKVVIASDVISKDAGVDLTSLVGTKVITKPAQLLGDVSLGGPGRLLAEAGQTLSATLTLLNGGPQKETYDLSWSAVAGSKLTGLPSTATVDPLSGSDLIIQIVPTSVLSDVITLTAKAQSNPLTLATTQIELAPAPSLTNLSTTVYLPLIVR